jgi:hypothetical protein
MSCVVEVTPDELSEAMTKVSIAETEAWRAVRELWEAESTDDEIAALCAESVLVGAQAAEQRAQQRLRGLQWRYDRLAAEQESERVRVEKRQRAEVELVARVVAAVGAADAYPLQQRDLAEILGVPQKKLAALTIDDPRVEFRRTGKAEQRGWYACDA